mgnify:CR=1 FL=1
MSTHRLHKAIVGQEKAKEILRHGEVKGHPLSEKQKGFFGARAGGAPVKRAAQLKALKSKLK